MKKSNRGLNLFRIFVIIVLLALGVMAFATNYINDNLNVTVCHATGSETNPYNKIVVSVKSVDDANGLNGHGLHLDDGWEPFIFLEVLYPGQNTYLFGSIIDSDCNIIVSTATPTEIPPTMTSTEVPPTETPTEISPTATPTEIAPTSSPTGTPVTPTSTPPDPTATSTQSNPTQPNPTPTSTKVAPTPTLVPTATNTPIPPVPAIGDSNEPYPGKLLGTLEVDGRSFELYQGVNAEDGSLLLPSTVRGGALYNNGIWIHRAWNSGWLVVNLDSKIQVTLTDGTVFNYTVSMVTVQGYGVYPKSDKLYIASCFSDGYGNWVGILVYTLE